MNRRRPLGIALPLVIGLLLTGCSVAGSPSIAGANAATGATTDLGRPAPLVSALTATGTMVMKTEVVHVDLAAVRSISADGATMTMSKSAAEKMQPGSLFVIDGVASRKVTGVAAAGDGATVQTEQATPDEIFADLDVSFQGSPSLDQAVVGGPAVAAPGADPALSSTGPAAATGTAVSSAPPSKLRSAGAALACKARTASIILNADPITVTPSITTNADCTGFTFTADVTASSGPVSAGIVLKGGLTILNLSGHLSAGSSGSSQSAGAQINGNIDVSGKAAAQEPGGWVRRYKMTWDALKVDYPVVIDGVPFVFRFGIPLILELRFSGNHDTVVGQYIGLQCKGLLNVGSDADSTAADICTMAPTVIDSFTSIAPSGLVFAAGIKVGFGPGIVVGEKAVAFAGVFATLSGSVGVTTTGATSAGLLDCIQMDRSAQLNVGVEANLGGLGASASRTVRQKNATNFLGSRCPKS